MQISESHCGPAVLQMQLSNLGVDVTQEEVAEAGDATQSIDLHGMRVDQIARALQRLAPQLSFYYKEHASIDELVRVVNDYRIPVGVEWQGLFEDEVKPTATQAGPDGPTPAGMLADSESEDSDYGHYSLVVWANRRLRQLVIVDPYKNYYSKTRIFGFDEFDRRWYDFNEVVNPLTSQPEIVEDHHLFFIVVRRNVIFPLRMGMRSFP